jgi:hypothetical protein
LFSGEILPFHSGRLQKSQTTTLYHLEHFTRAFGFLSIRWREMRFYETTCRLCHHQKDKVADPLKRQVCDGTLTQKEAQDQITADWYKIDLAHHQLVVNRPAAPSQLNLKVIIARSS